MDTKSFPSLKLELDQFPTKALVYPPFGRFEKRPLDPPPVLHIVSSDTNDRSHMSNIKLHVKAVLVFPNTFQEVPIIDDTYTPLSGTLLQSVIKLENLERKSTGFFIFGDLSSRLSGVFHIRFGLFCSSEGLLYKIHEIISAPFEVVRKRALLPVFEASLLTQTLKRQGEKLRTKTSTKKSKINPSSLIPSPVKYQIETSRGLLQELHLKVSPPEKHTQSESFSWSYAASPQRVSFSCNQISRLYRDVNLMNTIELPSKGLSSKSLKIEPDEFGMMFSNFLKDRGIYPINSSR
ncbi:hypothetical protein DSO57_1021743 [Entomophthora muscae]|uniref:Uncharacterized protein n=1 Tax=Entomophthora muscae TaxID=34485 RepID=A0ACC2RI62_9FUNG|nr:hypothetical protein DSO57_1021743 [Entomophthora muscae]